MMMDDEIGGDKRVRMGAVVGLESKKENGHALNTTE